MSTRERMCTSKRGYSKKDAQTAINFRGGKKKYTRHANRDLRMYQCPHCNKWHLTDNEPIDDYIDTN